MYQPIYFNANNYTIIPIGCQGSFWHMEMSSVAGLMVYYM